MCATGPRGERELRTRTVVRGMSMEVGPYMISGDVHTLAGVDALVNFRRRRPMVPLTNAEVRYATSKGPVCRVRRDDRGQSRPRRVGPGRGARRRCPGPARDDVAQAGQPDALTPPGPRGGPYHRGHGTGYLTRTRIRSPVLSRASASSIARRSSPVPTARCSSRISARTSSRWSRRRVTRRAAGARPGSDPAASGGARRRRPQPEPRRTSCRSTATSGVCGSISAPKPAARSCVGSSPAAMSSSRTTAPGCSTASDSRRRSCAISIRVSSTSRSAATGSTDRTPPGRATTS